MNCSRACSATLRCTTARSTARRAKAAHPLSTGRRDGDLVRCGYHGFAYDPAGDLVDVPSQDNVPRGVRVRTYPIIEQGPFIWIWLGDPGAAALRNPPRIPWFTDDDDWASTLQVLGIESNYLLLHEHYLDLTSVFTLHPKSYHRTSRCCPRWKRSRFPNAQWPTSGLLHPAGSRPGRPRPPAYRPIPAGSAARRGCSSPPPCTSSVT